MNRLLVLALAGSAACAPIAALPPTHVDTSIAARTVERVRDEGAVGQAIQEGTMVHVTVSHSCDVVEQAIVNRTTTVRRENQKKWLDATIGIVAAAAVGAGAWLMVDSSKVHDNDKTSRTYNPTGPSKALGYGIGATVGGVALLSIPIVDVVRAHRIDTKTERLTLNGEVVKSAVACSNQPLSNQDVQLRVAGSLLNVGTTNPQGRADIDVFAAVHVDLAPEALRGKVPIVVGTEQVGTFDLQPLYDAREEREWKGVDLESCRKPIAAESCDSTQAFAKRWTQGNHVAEAQMVLASARSEVDRLREERLWAATDIKSCASASGSPDDIENACRSVEQNYLAAFPVGPHATESRTAIETGLARAARLRAQLAKEAEREATREQRRLERAAINECRSRCQMGCSSWQIRDEGMCLVGCLTRCGDE